MTTYIFILLAGLVTSACAPFVPVKSDYSKNERLKAVWDERVQNREHLRRTLQSTTDATEKTRVTQSIKAINAEIVQIKVNMGYPYGPPEPVEAKTAEQSLNSAYIELKLADWKYGIVIDNQGVNESSAGTNGGALLGSALGNAAYIDRSFRPGNNYSAVTQLGVGIFGAILGSSLDSPSVSRYHFRYALRLQNGEIVYRDSVQQDAFRHPTGVCLQVSDLMLVSQFLCTN